MSIRTVVTRGYSNGIFNATISSAAEDEIKSLLKGILRRLRMVNLTPPGR